MNRKSFNIPFAQPIRTAIAVCCMAMLTPAVSAADTPVALGESITSISDLLERASKGDVPAHAELGQRYRRGQGVQMNFALAQELCGYAAAQESDEGKYCIALMLAEGEGQEPDRPRAAELYRALAARGHAKSMNNLGVLHVNGKFVNLSAAASISLMRRAADAGDTTAIFNLARYLSAGEILAKDTVAAERLFKQGYELTKVAADAGDPLAMEDLALDYLHRGNYAARDDVQALDWLERAWASKGRALTGVTLAGWYERGIGIATDKERAFALLQDVAARTESRAAEREMYRMLRFGIGTEPNLVLARQYARQAAEKGDNPAQFGLADMLEEGLGGPRSITEAMHWHHQAAVDGYINSQVNLALLQLKTGQAVDAAYWLEKAAEAGDRDAQYNLAELYLEGRGVNQKDVPLAAKWFEKAAEKGDVEAQHNLGSLYSGGKGLYRNAKKATYWFHRAALSGRPGSMVAYASLLEKGELADKNLEEAAQWFTKASDLGVPAGMYNLGRLYRDGRGVKRDYAKALALFTWAAIDGHMKPATEALAQMYERGQGVPRDAERAKAMRKP